jgi:hypothetical protein
VLGSRSSLERDSCHDRGPSISSSQNFANNGSVSGANRTLTVIAEFGGEKPERMLVPEDNPCNSELIMRLVNEVLFLRDQIQRVGKAIELVQAGKSFGLIPSGPHGQPDDK